MNPVSCQTAHSWISAIRQGAESTADVDWVALALHVECCSNCDHLLREFDGLDVDLSDAMGDFEVPVDGIDRVLSGLPVSSESLACGPRSTEIDPVAIVTAHDATISEHADIDSSSRRRGSRLAVWGMALVVAGVLCSLPYWSSWQTDQTIVVRLMDVQERLPELVLDWDQLPALSDRSLAVLPQVGWNRAGLDSSVRAWTGDRSAAAVHGAVWQFDAAVQDGARVRGALMVFPSERLENVPTARVFDPSSVRYSSRDGQQFASVAWHEGDHVYFCIVRNTPGALDRLQRLLSSGTV